MASPDIGSRCSAGGQKTSASALKVLRQKVKIYEPTEDEMQLWTKQSRAAWVGMKGTYDPALARRILEEQDQSALIQELESVGAL